MPISLKNEEDIQNQIDITANKLISKSSNLTYNKDTKYKVIEKYKEIRDNTANFMKTDKDGKVVIDRHKVVAGLTVAILKYKPISIKNEERATKKEFSANHFLAYLSSMTIMSDFLEEELKIKLHITTYIIDYMAHFRDLLINNKGMINRIGIDNSIKEDLESQCIFFISHIMYHLEKYMLENKKLVKCIKDI